MKPLHYNNIFIILCILMTLCVVSSKRNSLDVNRCTKNDSRSVFTFCFYQRQVKIMWCENSNFTHIPHPREVKHDGRYCHESNMLLINDSCLQRVNAGDLRRYPNLKKAVLSKNKLKTVYLYHFQHLKQLEELDLSDNEISHVFSFKVNSILKSLDLSDNFINEARKHSFQNMGMLSELKLDDNVISRLHGYTFTYNNNLRYLSLTGNKIQSVDQSAFYNLNGLEVLRLDGNQITKLESGTFSWLPHLKELSISYNKLTVVPSTISANLPNIQMLNLANNSLAQLLPNDLQNMSHLVSLSLQNNSLSQIESGVFETNLNLSYINLERNELEWISDDAFLPPCNLVYLMLNHNRLTTPNPSWFHHVINNSNGQNFPGHGDGNPWRCDCAIVPFYDYYAGKSRLTTVWMEKLQIECQDKRFRNEKLDYALVHNIKQIFRCKVAAERQHSSTNKRRKREPKQHQKQESTTTTSTPTAYSTPKCTTNLNTDGNIYFVNNKPYVPREHVRQPNYKMMKYDHASTTHYDKIVLTIVGALCSVTVLLSFLLIMYCVCGRPNRFRRREVYL